MKKGWLVLIVATGLVLGMMSSLQADEGDGIIQAHPISPYPNAVRQNESEPYVVLTKDPIDTVKQFFEGQAQKGDRLEPVQESQEKGWRINYYEKLGQKEQVVMEAEMLEISAGDNIVDALGALKSQSLMGKHSEQEYQALEKKYMALDKAYFRKVDDGSGRTISEDKLLYKRAEQEAYPEKDRKKAADASNAFTDNDKAKAKELQAQMKALKAKGDVAGMMKLAQESKMSSTQSAAVNDAMAVATKDTWDIWAKCLEDTWQAAYWSRITYNSNAVARQAE
ncbi:MAG: hypothetical protein AB1724_04985 [Thermodesulfobacteriota bacterium]